jgi:flagellar protein FliS
MSHLSNSAMNAYRKTGASTQVAEASPHRLVQLMLEGAVDRLAAARGHIERGHVAEKGEALSRVLALVDTLNASLDMEKGGAVASNLRRLYEYSIRRLTEANIRGDATIVAEVQGLLREVKAGWDAIPEAARSARP